VFVSTYKLKPVEPGDVADSAYVQILYDAAVAATSQHAF